MAIGAVLACPPQPQVAYIYSIKLEAMYIIYYVYTDKLWVGISLYIIYCYNIITF